MPGQYVVQSFSRLTLHDMPGGRHERPWSEKKEADEKSGLRKMCFILRSVSDELLSRTVVIHNDCHGCGSHCQYRTEHQQLQQHGIPRSSIMDVLNSMSQRQSTGLNVPTNTGTQYLTRLVFLSPLDNSPTGDESQWADRHATTYHYVLLSTRVFL